MEIPLRTVAVLSRAGKLPEYVKSASADHPADLPSGAYADPGRKRLPLHTKSAAFLSFVEFAASGGTDPVIRNRIRKAASLHGVLADAEAAVAGAKTASAATDYALEMDGDKLFPIGGPEEIKRSAALLADPETVSRLPYAARKTAASAILAAAREKRAFAGLPDLNYLAKAAGAGGKDRGTILGWLRHRTGLVKSDIAVREKMAMAGATPEETAAEGDDNPYLGILKAAKALPEEKFEDRDALFKLAEALDAADRLTGNHRRYAYGLITPEEICFSGVEEAEPLTIKAGKVELTIDELRKSGLTIDDFRALGRKFTDRIKSADAWRTSSKGIDYAALAAASADLEIGDRLILARILRSAQ